MAKEVKNHMPRTISFVELWDEILTAHVMKHHSNYGERRTKNAYVDLLGLYSGEDNITYVYTIDGYPKELENSFRTTLRSSCHAGVRISFISPLEKYQIDWASPQMKTRMRVWRNMEDDGGKVDEYNLYENLENLDTQSWRRDSVSYLVTAELRRKRKMFKFTTLMLISGSRGPDFDTSVKEIEHTCKLIGLNISRVIGDIPEYLKLFSPFSRIGNPKVEKQCGSISLPDELLSRFNTYAQGTIGRKGIYWGTDIYSNFPCLKQVKITPESPENWLLTAETGGGKSYFTKALLLQLLAQSQYNGTIMDVEGFEYIPLHNLLSYNDVSVLLNMGEGTGAYFDPVEIIQTGDAELDKDMYSLSTSFTLSLFKCLMGNIQDEDEWTDIVINDAVSLTYGRRNVDAFDSSTWVNAKGLTIYDVYKTLKSLKTTGDVGRAVATTQAHSMWEEKQGIGKQLSQNDVSRLITSNEGYQKAIDMCIAKISRYFEPNGVRASLFNKRISLEQVKDAKLVICSFGMAGKSPNTVDPIQMALMQLYSANISHLRSIFSKHAGKYNFKLWEEFQRWGGFPDADKTINVALTGGRKLGDINIIITNKVVDMLNEDRFGVFSNITSIAIGCIWDAEVRQALCERLTIEEMIPELNRLVENNRDLSSYVDGDTLMSNPYSKAFLIGLDKTAYTLSRMSLPKGLRESPIFKTGIILKKPDTHDSEDTQKTREQKPSIDVSIDEELDFL